MNFKKKVSIHFPLMCAVSAVFTLTHLPEARYKENWIRTSENYERICLNKHNIFLNLAFGQEGEKINAKTVQKLLY